MVYTDDAAKDNGGDAGIKAKAGSGVGNVNTFLKNSGVSVTLKLKATAKWNHSSSGDVQSDLGALSKDATIKALRTQHKADLVSALVPGEGSGTVGYGSVGQTSGNKNACWTVVRAKAVGSPSYTFTHEVGHNLGGGHSDGGGGEGTAKGLRFTGTDDKDYRTVMAYQPGICVQHFSNPAKSYKGKPTGTDSANNAATITKIGPKVSGYE